MKQAYNPNYPSIDDLRLRAQKKIPRFAFEYLDGGCNEDVNLHKKYAGQIKIMMDSGLRSGPDIARTLASGAEFAFLGRSFMYGVAALGNAGGTHTISILKTQLRQVMEQICCKQVADFPNYLIK